MSCLDNTDILRIVGGNSFQIAITVKARRVSDGSEIEDFDLSASSPVLNLIHAGEKTRKYFVTQGNQAIISFDGSEGLGYYGMEMSGSYDSEAWRFCIEKVLQLVDTNAKANIPEWSFLVDDTYFIEGTISIYGGGGGGDTVQADWTETNPISAAFILHKPDLSVYATKTEVASGLAGKQDTIVDLTSIRYGAAAGATAYQKPGTGIPESDMSEGVQTSLDKADSAYQLPANGIPASDMDSEVQASLEKANSAVQTETDPVFSGSPAAEITQADINTWNAKQPAISDLAAIREGAAAGATAVQPDEMAQAIDGVDGEIADINAKIPSTASNLNQLADKAYVNSSIATNSATYRGSFNLITDLGMNVDATHTQIAGALATAITTADNNDYAFVQIPDSASTPTVIAKIERYKHNGSGWVYEYDLNNSGFTAAQWAAINSGITSGLVGKLSDLPNNSELATLLNGKQNVINDLATIRSGASAGATAVQPADLTEALNGVEAEIAGLDESKQDTIEDLSTIRSGAAAGATAYQKPASGIPESDMSEGVQTSLGKADSAYQKPASGIPATDMSEGVQASLAKANSAVQTETDPVFSNSPAAEITQADINNWNAKQPAIADLADIREGAAAGATAVQPDEMAQAIDEVDGDIDAINAKIPSAASNLNQLADKAYVNSSIATNSATYRGSFNLITDLGMNIDATHSQIAGALATAITTADNNDYAFVQIPDSASTPTVIAKIERYKHNGTGWVYEYYLNNSGFTAAQWAAINSGITSGLVGKLADLPNNSELATLLNGKQNVINDLATIRSGASAGATAVQPADLTEALNGVEAEIAGLDESKQDTIEDLSTIRSGAAAGATAYQKPASGIPESDMSEGVQTSLGKADSAYQKPVSGIPATDMSESVQESLARANSAVQTESDPVFSNSPSAEITQADINNWNAKQSAIADLADIREGAAAGATAVQPDEMAQAIDGVEGDIEDINAKIPTDASSLNQLADKAYVNSSIATNSATYRGSFNLITDLGMNVDATHAQIAGALATAIVTADNNDYAFVQIPDSASTPTVIAKIERYKHNGTGWVYEYDLNNSGFTAAQWAAINSGITSGLVGKLSDLPNNSELATLLNGKQNVINDLSAIRSGASAGATAYQKPSGGIPASDMSGTVQQELSKANTAVQTETDPIFSASPAAGITAQNIQTWNGEPAARQAADTALQNSVSALQTDLAAETSARQSADTALQAAIQNEATARTTTDALLQQQYNALTQSDIIVGALPVTGVANVIYRVPGTTDFTDYMWYDNQFVPMATYGLPISAEFVIDDNLNKTQEEVNGDNFHSLESKVEISSINLFNLQDPDFATGKFISTNGSIGSNATYDISGYIKVKAETVYTGKYWSGAGWAAMASSSSTALNFYDKNKTRISTIVVPQAADNYLFTTPANAYYIRTTLEHARRNFIFVYEGSASLDYCPYNPIYNWLEGIVNLKQLSDRIRADIESVETNFGYRLVTSTSISTYSVVTSPWGGTIPQGTKVKNNGVLLYLYSGSTHVSVASGATITLQSEVTSIRTANVAGIVDLTVYGQYDIDQMAQDVAANTAKLAGKVQVTDLSTETVIDEVYGKNLIIENDPDWMAGKFINASGNTGTNPIYDTTGYIPVENGKTYMYKGFNEDGDTAVNGLIRFVSGYTSSKTFKENLGEQVGTFTISDSTVAYVRLSVLNSSNPSPKVYKQYLQEGTAPVSAYEPYYHGYKIKEDLLREIQDGSIEEEKLSPEVQQKLNATQPAQQNSMTIVGDMADGASLELPRNSVKVRKSIGFSAKIGSWSGSSILTVGHGTSGNYLASWIEVDNTNVVVKYYTTSAVTVKTVAHGLTIQNNLQVKIWKGWSSDANILICSNGSSFSTTGRWYGDNGKVTANITGGSLSDCTLGWYSDALLCANWIFGDSYLSIEDPKRWAYYLNSQEHKDNLVNAFSGEGSSTAIVDLQNLLDLRTPTRVVWCLGMNDADSSSAVNADWKAAYDTLLGLKESKGFDLVLAALPNVIGDISTSGDTSKLRRNQYKNDIVRSSGYRFIDFESAVGATLGGLWYGTTELDIINDTNNGMLSSDGVHPTKAGAKSLYYQAISDCPEMVTF